MVRGVSRCVGTMPGLTGVVAALPERDGEREGRGHGAGHRGGWRLGVKAASTPPRGVNVVTRGQLGCMIDMFESPRRRPGHAVIVILILLTAYFESPRSPWCQQRRPWGALRRGRPARRGAREHQSFMGAIMCIGVSVSNSVML